MALVLPHSTGLGITEHYFKYALHHQFFNSGLYIVDDTAIMTHHDPPRDRNDRDEETRAHNDGSLDGSDGGDMADSNRLLITGSLNMP